MELGWTMAGVGINPGSHAATKPVGGGSSLPPPPPLNTAAAFVAMARAGVKLTSEQLKGLSDADRKAAKKARKEAKKVLPSFYRLHVAKYVCLPSPKKTFYH